MSSLIARNDAVVVRQVTTLTPVAANNAVYKISLNTKFPDSYTADASATAKEIVEGLQPLLAASTIAEVLEAVWTEDDLKIIATGLATGQPFTVVDGSTGGGSFTLATPTVAKSPNHWIAENFSGGVLPADGDTVTLTQLAVTQSFYWGLDQSAIDLALLDIRQDSEAQVGLPEITTTAAGSYYQAGYRDTHLKIGTAVLRIGDGTGQGSGRLKILLNDATACSVTVFQTGTTRADQDEAPVHLAGSNAANTIQVMSGAVDIAMLAGYTSQWASVGSQGNSVIRCGTGVTLGVVRASGESRVETRSAVTTLRTRDNGRVEHSGSGTLGEADVNGGTLTVRATGAMTITLLNGYAGKILDLTQSDSLVTVTNMNCYGTPEAPFTILDPNNKLVMTNPAACPNGTQSLVVKTGSNKNLRVT